MNEIRIPTRTFDNLECDRNIFVKGESSDTREAAKKTSGNCGTESHFHAVDSCQICHLSNYINQSPRYYHDSSNQERGSDSDPT